VDLDKELKKLAICFTVTNYKLIVKEKNNQEMNLLNKSLIQILRKEENFDENDFKEILRAIKDKDFDDLKLYLYDRLDNFKDCLELYLVKDLNIAEKRDEKVYNWINNKIKALQDVKDKYKLFIKTIENHTMELAVLSILKFFELSKDIFSQNYKQVVE
jgi:hypothetical protein